MKTHYKGRVVMENMEEERGEMKTHYEGRVVMENM